tara:strand:- start:486 stop:830 length:345 start_codon:yes stop_codon:yes gene_type:complete
VPQAVVHVMDEYDKITNPVSIAAAKNTMIKCLREKAEMESNLSGCDWCCGGGDEAMRDINRTYHNAKGLLESKGVIFDPESKLCSNCVYYDRETNDILCILCNEALELEALERK